ILRLSMDSGVKREDFLARYTGHELDRNWLHDVFNPKPVERVKKVVAAVKAKLGKKEAAPLPTAEPKIPHIAPNLKAWTKFVERHEGEVD
ncbi:hypothetical protein ACSTHX_00585, partial [Vibrio parahaemolyticus]